MYYELLNKTDIPNDILQILIDFACPYGLEGFSISFIKSPYKWSGIYGQAVLNKKHVDVCVGKSQYPNYSHDRDIEKFGYTPNFKVNNKEEDLVATISHELRHLWQCNVSKRNFLNGKIFHYTHWDKKNYTSISKMESDSCKYSYNILKKFRKEMKKIT